MALKENFNPLTTSSGPSPRSPATGVPDFVDGTVLREATLESRVFGLSYLRVPGEGVWMKVTQWWFYIFLTSDVYILIIRGILHLLHA